MLRVSNSLRVDGVVPVCRQALVPLVLAALAAFAVGLLAIRWTALAVVQAHFWKFSFYCLVAGLVALVVLT